MKKIIIWLILILIININTEAATLNSSSINNGVKKAEYPDSKDVEPRVNQYDETTALEAGIENTIEVQRRESCLEKIYFYRSRIFRVYERPGKRPDDIPSI